jgi:transcriptional regulator with XRE-family HTH domain
MKLSAYRDEKKLTATELGRRLGVAHTTVLRWEAGEMFPSAEMLLRIEKETAGKVTPNDLFVSGIPAATAPA